MYHSFNWEKKKRKKKRREKRKREKKYVVGSGDCQCWYATVSTLSFSEFRRNISATMPARRTKHTSNIEAIRMKCFTKPMILRQSYVMYGIWYILFGNTELKPKNGERKKKSAVKCQKMSSKQWIEFHNMQNNCFTPLNQINRFPFTEFHSKHPNSKTEIEKHFTSFTAKSTRNKTIRSLRTIYDLYAVFRLFFFFSSFFASDVRRSDTLKMKGRANNPEKSIRLIMSKHKSNTRKIIPKGMD